MGRRNNIPFSTAPLSTLLTGQANLFISLDWHQSLKTLKTTKVLKTLISSDGRRHLKWCQHLSPCLSVVDDSKFDKVPTTCHLHHRGTGM
jgi:hypothetical protein